MGGGDGAEALRFDIQYQGDILWNDNYYFIDGKFTDHPENKIFLGNQDDITITIPKLANQKSGKKIILNLQLIKTDY